MSPWSVAAIVLAAATTGVGPRGAAQPPAGRPQCCYTNPQYAGVCAVQAGEGETCASIRAYLNNPTSQGKNYCGNTSIRGKWKQVKCAGTTLTRPS